MDCWFQIIINCDIDTINNILLTCHDLNSFRQNKHMWKMLIERNFKTSGTSMTDYQEQIELKYFRKIYKEKYDSNLDYLDLNNNRITKIPSDWNPQLNNLLLSNNQITEIPSDWNPQLNILSLYCNPITKEQIDNFKKRNPNIIVHF